MSHVVFVYGTLREGEYNHRVMQSEIINKLGAGRVSGKMFDLGSFPAVTLTGEQNTVVGEWYEITDRGLANCDRLEGYPGFYNRSVVQDLDNPEIQGYLYHIDDVVKRYGSRVRPIESGDWLNRAIPQK